MPNTEPSPEDREAAALAAYALRCNGFEITLLQIDGAGVRLAATRAHTPQRFMTRPGFKDLD